jgi:hypothetical protein
MPNSCAAMLFFVRVLIALVFLNAKHVSASVPSSCVARAVGAAENILVAGFPLKVHTDLASEYLFCRRFRHEFDKSLGRYFLGFPRTHRNWGYIRAVRFWNTLNYQIQFQPNFKGFRASEILEVQNDSGIFTAENFAVNERSGVKQNIRSFTNLRATSAISVLFLAASADILVAAVCSFRSLKVPRAIQAATMPTITKAS